MPRALALALKDRPLETNELTPEQAADQIVQLLNAPAST
jgi:hypothetical protein